MTVTTRTNRLYIGSVTIPFSTIYANGRVKGEFRVDTPDSSLGYRHMQVSREGAGRSSSSSVVTAASLDTHGPGTYLFLSAAVDPPLPMASDRDDEPLPVKDRALIVLGRRFEAAIAKRGRSAQVFGSNMKVAWPLPPRAPAIAGAVAALGRCWLAHSHSRARARAGPTCAGVQVSCAAAAAAEPVRVEGHVCAGRQAAGRDSGTRAVRFIGGVLA